MRSSAMKRVLVLYYSQSGDVSRAAEALLAPLTGRGAEVVWRRIEPCTPYPYPWGKIDRFFDVFPECVVGDAPEIQPLDLAGEKPFDLVVLAYQVWFLSPSLPMQGFFKSPAANVLRQAPVVTLSVSRNMRWLAGKRLRRMLQDVEAEHVGEIAITHQGSPLATFLTTPRALLTGRRDRLWGVLPAAGVGRDGLDRLESLGEKLAAWLHESRECRFARPIDDEEAAPVNWRYLFSELAAWPSFFAWARIVRTLGYCGPGLRRLGVSLFIVWLVLCIAVFVPLGLAVSPLVLLLSQCRLSRSKSRRKSPYDALPRHTLLDW